MKKAITTTAVVAALVLSLAACGVDTGNNGILPDANDPNGILPDAGGDLIPGGENGTTTNGTTTNGTTTNGTTTNGTTTNGTTTNGTTTNGTTTNGTTANGTTTNGTNANGTTANGTTANGTTANGTTANGTTANGTANYGTNMHYGTQRYTNGTANTTVRDLADGARYRLMLDNARVRDSDGFLFDGENAHHDTFR